MLIAASLGPAQAATTTTSRKATTTTTVAARRGPTTTTTPAESPESGRQGAIKTELTTLRAQVSEASAKEAAVLDALDEVAATRRSIDAQVADIEAELATVEAEIEAASERLGALGADLQRAEVKLSATETDLNGARSELTDRAVRAYIRQPVAQLASVLLERQSFRELAATRDFLHAMVEAQARSIDRYQALRRELSGERRDLTTVRDEAARHREEVAFYRQQLVEVRARRLALRTSAVAEEARQKTLLADVRSRVREFEAEIAALKKESDAIGVLLRARQKAQKKSPSGTGALSAPVGGVITSGFGPRRHPIFGTMRMHNGIDFSAPSGTPVRAAADGVVVVAGERGGYGTTVLVDHGNTLGTLYAHLSRAAVAEGASVTRGTVIAYAGSSGYSTGPHLHFEVRANGQPVDPRRYL